MKIARLAGVGLAIHLAAFAGDVSADSWQPFGLADHVRTAVPDGAGLDRLDRALRAATPACRAKM